MTDRRPHSASLTPEAAGGSLSARLLAECLRTPAVLELVRLNLQPGHGEPGELARALLDTDPGLPLATLAALPRAAEAAGGTLEELARTVEGLPPRLAGEAAAQLLDEIAGGALPRGARALLTAVLSRLDGVDAAPGPLPLLRHALGRAICPPGEPGPPDPGDGPLAGALLGLALHRFVASSEANPEELARILERALAEVDPGRLSRVLRRSLEQLGELFIARPDLLQGLTRPLIGALQQLVIDYVRALGQRLRGEERAGETGQRPPLRRRLFGRLRR